MTIVKFPRWQVEEDFRAWGQYYKLSPHQRFGQWFCNKNYLQNSILFYETDPNKALQYIYTNLTIEG